VIHIFHTQCHSYQVWVRCWMKFLMGPRFFCEVSIHVFIIRSVEINKYVCTSFWYKMTRLFSSCANVYFITHWTFSFCSFTQYLVSNSSVVYKRHKPWNTHYGSSGIEHYCLEYLTRCQKAVICSVNQWCQY
jgi:hypothetical protein